MTIGDEKTGSRVHKLTPAEVNAKMAAGTARPRPGAHVSLWRLPGRWGVWSIGHTGGHRWLQPIDETAHELAAVAADPATRAEVQPVVESYSSGAIEVRTREIKAWISVGGEA